MATLVMTIDSDSEAENKKPTKANKAKKPQIIREEDEEILLGHSVILDDKPMTGQVPHVRVGSNQQWKFTDVLQVDNHKRNLDMDFEVTTKDERPPF